MATKHKDIQTIFDGILAFIKEAGTLLDEHPVDEMKDMQADVAYLCDKINALPIKERVTYEKEMGELAAALRDLEEKLLAKREEVKGDMQSTATHKRASKAYVTADHRDKREKKTDG